MHRRPFLFASIDDLYFGSDSALAFRGEGAVASVFIPSGAVMKLLT